METESEKMTENIDQKIFAEWISDGASVLDLGCGDGSLLGYLTKTRRIRGQGIELNPKAISLCVSEGLNVYQQDIDSGLSEYEDNSFDYVILNQTLQQVKKPAFVLQEALRVGKHVVVGIPNFAYIKARTSIFFRGRVPVTPALPYQWYDTPNLHFLSLADFKTYCQQNHITIQRSAFRSGNRRIRFQPNLLAQTGYFLLQKMPT
jgi:methionine biosynthesis protein MetW